jgi:signal peptidase II
MHAMQDETGTPLTPSPHPTSTAAPAPDQVQGRSRLFALLVGVGLLTLALDQGSKAWALATLTPGEPRDLVGPALRLNLIRNAGAAFSLGDGVTWLLTIVALGIVVWVGLAARRVGHRWWAVTLGLLLGGAVGNLIDRILREPGLGRGHVVDFIDYFGLFIGNIADLAIVGAAVLGALLALRGIPLEGVTHGRHEADHVAHDTGVDHA